LRASGQGWSCRPPSGRWPCRFVGLTLLRPVAASLGNRLPRRSPPILRPQTLVDLCRQSAHRRSRLRAPVRRLRSLSSVTLRFSTRELFRGGSEGFKHEPHLHLANLSQTFPRVLPQRESYYFTDLPYVEFSGRLAAISAGLAILASALAVRQRKLRLLLGLAWLTILNDLGNKCHGHNNLPGLRRQTPALGAFLRPLALAWREFGLARIRRWLVRALAVVAASALAPPVCIPEKTPPASAGWVVAAVAVTEPDAEQLQMVTGRRRRRGKDFERLQLALEVGSGSNNRPAVSSCSYAQALSGSGGKPIPADAGGVLRKYIQVVQGQKQQPDGECANSHVPNSARPNSRQARA